ncbi:shikimate dehydrogenase family protein [Streptomyces sp. MAR4 CNX-425]|uniref:shikimate dehydrogenase family protein n=1 Tax=Streptomyces sp. MAR4 CNX-425 TaxID=3406343 RepID=UPI003B50DC3F
MTSSGPEERGASITPPISGATRLYAVLGDPVAQVRAPALLNALFGRLGRDAVLVPVLATPDDFTDVVGGLKRVGNLDGMLFTVPHKAAAARLADRRSTVVTVAGGANAMRREPDGSWSAENFDGAGFVRGLAAAGHVLRGRRVTVSGAGGAGSSIAVALLDAGVGGLSLYDPDAERLAALLKRLDEHWPGRSVGTEAPELELADIVVNATPLGMRPDDPLPFDPARVPPGRVVADIVMKPRLTRLLKRSASLGLTVHPGIHMLDAQLDSYRHFFRLG